MDGKECCGYARSLIGTVTSLPDKEIELAARLFAAASGFAIAEALHAVADALKREAVTKPPPSPVTADVPVTVPGE